MNDCKKNLIVLFQFFDGYFDTDFRIWKIPNRYAEKVLKSMKVYNFNIQRVNSIKDDLLCKIVDKQNKRTLAFVLFYKGRIKTV